MNYQARITGIKEDEVGTHLKVLIPGEQVQKEILKFRNGSSIKSEIRIDDNRSISSEQRKKIYATLRDIADYTGDVPEYLKEYLKFEYCMESGEEYFSLSDCSVTTARLFINYIMDFILMHDISLSDKALNRTDDIDHYLWSCLKYHKCCICGLKGEIHHWDAIGSGRDRRQVDDSQLRKMCLCRIHHTQAHQLGRDTFETKYHVYGVIFDEEGANNVNP